MSWVWVAARPAKALGRWLLSEKGQQGPYTRLPDRLVGPYVDQWPSGFWVRGVPGMGEMRFTTLEEAQATAIAIWRMKV